MAFNSKAEAAIPDTSAGAEPMASNVHPRILERIQLVALAKRRDMLLVQLDRLIAGLHSMSHATDRCSIQLAITRDLRDQVTCMNFEGDDIFIITDKIKQHMVDVTTLLTELELYSAFEFVPTL